MTTGHWLAPGKQAAVCFSIDDVHPTAADGQHPDGATSHQVLDRLDGLLTRHPQLRVTLFTTPDWRSRGVHRERRGVASLPLLNRLVYATRPHARGTLRLDRHHAVSRRLASMARTEVALHGLHHVRRGLRPNEECTGLPRRRASRLIAEGQDIMARAGVPLAPGFAPPAWEAPVGLLEGMRDCGLRFIASARDLDTPVTPTAIANGNGLRGVALCAPAYLERWRLVHLPTNFQATSSTARALAIIEQGGLLSVKAHFLERLGSYVALDGLSEAYTAQLDALFSTLDRRYGAALWWPSMSELSERVHARVAATGVAP